MKLFKKKGFHRATTREIAKEAGFSIGTLYEYIRTKEDNLEWLKNHTVSIAQAEKLTAEELKDKIITGEFVNIENAREYSNRYNDVIARAKKA